MTIEADVTDASLAFDSPAVYEVEHESVSRVLSFTHTYSGQALAGETIEACGVCERHGTELGWSWVPPGRPGGSISSRRPSWDISSDC